MPLDVNPEVLADVAEAIDLANRYDLYFTFVLFSAPSELPESWLANELGRQRLAQALGNLFAYFANEPRIFSWEVFNEPEWDMWGNVVSASATVSLVEAIARSVHDNSSALVSVGSANLEGLSYWKGIGLDYFDAHWYDPMTSPSDCARCTDYASVQAKYQLDAPLLIGEFYAGPDTDAYDRFSDFYDKGYAGAWAWSLFPERTQDGLSIDFDALAEFSAAHADDLGP